jgi:hypothetical protein
MGHPSTRELTNLNKLRAPNWQTGIAISLAHPDASTVSLNHEWRLASPAIIDDLITLSEIG